MNFKVGQVFEKNGNTYCVLDLIAYNNKNYVLFSIENKKFYFDFYEITELQDSYNLKRVSDQLLFNELMEIFERKEAYNE